MNARGVDVSHWQPTTPDLTGLTFLIAKASEGIEADPLYQTHIANARAKGLLVGAYAFNRDDVDVAAQVATFAKAAGSVDFYAIDVEGTHAFSEAQTKDFISRFRALTGKRIGLYHSESGFFDAGQDWDWIAHWGVSAPARLWDLHQYRGDPLDLDQFNGTPAEMRVWAAGLAGGTHVNAFSVPEARTLAKMKTGVWLYDNSDLLSSTGNIKIDPGRELVYVGQFSTTPDIRIVAYEPATEDTNTTSKAMFCVRDSVESFRKEPDLTPYDQHDIDAAVTVAVTPLEATISTQAATIQSLNDDIVVYEGVLASTEEDLKQVEADLMVTTSALEQANAVVDEYDDLRVSLRKAVAP